MTRTFASAGADFQLFNRLSRHAAQTFSHGTPLELIFKQYRVAVPLVRFYRLSKTCETIIIIFFFSFTFRPPAQMISQYHSPRRCRKVDTAAVRSVDEIRFRSSPRDGHLLLLLLQPYSKIASKARKTRATLSD